MRYCLRSTPSCLRYLPVPESHHHAVTPASSGGIASSIVPYTSAALLHYSCWTTSRSWNHRDKMLLRLRSLAAVSCVPLALAQSSTNSAVHASTIPAAPIASILSDTGIIPSALVDLAATYVASAANGVQTALIEALSKPGVDPRKLHDPELFYTYGHSPPVYPSRTCPQR